MRIGFIGAGKVGFTLGKYFAENGAEISGYYSLYESDTKEAAEFVGCTAYDDRLKLVSDSDVIFITVPDGQIQSEWLRIASASRAGEVFLRGKMFLHCSGAHSSRIFESADRLNIPVASLHPMFAVSNRTEAYKELGKAFFTIEGDDKCVDAILPLMEQCGNVVQRIEADVKVRYHAAAVMASNQVIALYRVASNQLVQCGFTPESAEAALRPLFMGNAQHIVEDGTVAALTGPAERGDKTTINKHLDCLEGEDAEIYRLLTNVLYDIAAEKHASQMG